MNRLVNVVSSRLERKTPPTPPATIGESTISETSIQGPGGFDLGSNASGPDPNFKLSPTLDQGREGKDTPGTVSAYGITPFVEHLINSGVVLRGTAEKAHAWREHHQDARKRRLMWTLIDHFHADREQIFKEFVKYYSINTFDLSSATIDSDKLAFIRKALETLPPQVREIAQRERILPYQLNPNDSTRLHIITPDPTSASIGLVARASGYPRYDVYYVALSAYEELWREITVDFQNRPAAPKLEIVEEEEEIDVEALDEEIRKGQLNETIEETLESAVRINASDIHIVPRSSRKIEFYFRIDGYLSLWQTLEKVRADAVSAVVKEIAKGPDRFERDMAQDGFFQKEVDGKIVRFRVSIIPMVGRELKLKSESIVIRVLQDPEANITIQNLGFAPDAFEKFKKSIEKPHGIVILTGPTGSGKSTTLLAALRGVMSPQLNTVTVEDPVEYLIEGARQVKLSPKLDFEAALRAILRHDPDIVMVGEIRDRPTADIAVKLANTGHLTFATLHTNDAPGAIARLYKMGVEPFLLAYSINVIVAQRLLRKLCERCKAVDTEMLPVTLEKIGFPMDEFESTTFYRPVGCNHCFKGYKGRRAVHEVLYFTKEIRQLILEAGSSINEEAIRLTARQQGMRELMESAVDVLKLGITTAEEVAATTASD